MNWLGVPPTLTSTASLQLRVSALEVDVAALQTEVNSLDSSLITGTIALTSWENNKVYYVNPASTTIITLPPRTGIPAGRVVKMTFIKCGSQTSSRIVTIDTEDGNTFNLQPDASAVTIKFNSYRFYGNGFGQGSSNSVTFYADNVGVSYSPSQILNNRFDVGPTSDVPAVSGSVTAKWSGGNFACVDRPALDEIESVLNIPYTDVVANIRMATKTADSAIEVALEADTGSGFVKIASSVANAVANTDFSGVVSWRGVFPAGYKLRVNLIRISGGDNVQVVGGYIELANHL